MCDRPLAAQGLTSYRYKGTYSWIMISARPMRCAQDMVDGMLKANGVPVESIVVADPLPAVSQPNK